MSNRIDLTRFIALADKMAAAHDEMGLEGMGIHHAEAHSALLEAIAELKKCYELIDAQKENLAFTEEELETISEAVEEYILYDDPDTDPKDLIGGIPVADRCNSIQRKITQVFWSQGKGTTQCEEPTSE